LISTEPRRLEDGPNRPDRTCERLSGSVLSLERWANPAKIDMEIPNRSNLHCTTFVVNSWWDEFGYISSDLCRRLIAEPSQFPRFTIMTFGGFGEPLSHPDLLEMAYLADERRRVCMSNLEAVKLVCLSPGTKITLLDWLKHEGDHVQVGDPLYIVEGRKGISEIECEVEGTLEKIVQKRGVVKSMGQEIAYIRVG
jgi:Biotin-requiring enzyme